MVRPRGDAGIQSLIHSGREVAMAHTRRHIKRERAESRAYSQAVITEGGRIVWLAGQVAIQDAAGTSLVGNFDGQVREIFRLLGETLKEAGGKLGDMVTMTVFITDQRYGDRLTELRKEIFGGDFPASALITCRALARPEMLVEVQGIAVVG
jgi:enamine deaminase RidA (YjgF/YER057c/UK114 family)